MKKIILTVFFLSTLSITGEAFSKNALSYFQSSASVSQTCHIGNINDINNPYLAGFGSKISSGQDVAIGSYTDTVGVTITF